MVKESSFHGDNSAPVSNCEQKETFSIGLGFIPIICKQC